MSAVEPLFDLAVPPGRSVTFIVPGRPVPWARAGHNGARSFTPPKQREAMRAVRWAAAAVRATPIEGPVRVMMTFAYAWPSGAPQRLRGAVRYRVGKPDIDNLAKLAMDALSGIAWRDDAQVVSVVARKISAPHEGTTITITPLDGEQDLGSAA
jgi:Holliday junction resolvase RusA-like endonuclease